MIHVILLVSILWLWFLSIASRTKPTFTKKKKCKKAKWLSEEALQIEKREKKRSERQRRKEKIYPSECKVPKNGKER